MKRCPGSEGSIAIRRKAGTVASASKTRENGDESVSNESGSDCGNDSSMVTFSQEQEDLFSRRFEEGYDVRDEEYVQWLSLNHPEAVSAMQNSISDEHDSDGSEDSSTVTFSHEQE